ncbi:MAG: methyltransferase domain-containing protein [Desulfobacter sp.]|nr:MAG: methyltransferase domain-containing protein [Desulfobacter sp.]
MTIPANPQAILSLSRNFMECRVLLTGAELDIFTYLAEPASSRALAERQGWHERPLAVVLDALAAMGLLIKADGQYHTDPGLLPLLTSGSPRSVLPMVKHAATIWKNWSNLTRIVAETGRADKIPARFEGEDQKAFIGAMHVVGRKHAPAIVQAVQPGPARRLLDVGGGSGTYTMAFLEASPQMSATIFDLPEVVDMGRARIEASGLKDRVDFVAGNFYTDALPPGYDLALLSAIIHQNSLEQNLALYKKIWTVLIPEGRLVIRDHVMEKDRTAPKSGAIFAINMLVGTPGGGTYTYEEIEAGLVEAGFEKIRLIQGKDQMMGLVEAYRPA